MIESWFEFCRNYAGQIFTAASAILLAELLLPQGKPHSLMSRVRGALFWAVYIAITGAALILFQRLWAHLGVKPLLSIDLSILSGWSGNAILSGIGGIVSMLLVIQVGEFFYYWFHRAQHTSRFLWRFHAEHHSLEEMNAFNSNHHFTEELFRIPFITIPMSLLFSLNPGYVPWIFAFLMGWQGIFEHSATKINLGRLRYLIPDNRFHRIHHSVEKKHFNKNFGSGSALWDIVFRTAHFPDKNEWPDVGLASKKEPDTLKTFLFRPFAAKPRVKAETPPQRTHQSVAE